MGRILKRKSYMDHSVLSGTPRNVGLAIRIKQHRFEERSGKGTATRKGEGSGIATNRY